MILALTFMLVGCTSQKGSTLNFTNEQKDKIQNTFLAVLRDEVEYTEDVSNVMTKEIYNSINMGNHYTTYTKINAAILDSKFVSKDDKILLYLSLNINVENGTKIISEAIEVPIVLTIKEDSTGYLIEEKQEYLSKNDIPKVFK